ncbi:WbuC family cupin fold metalloprotein [Leptospira noguchii]|uniref:Cupin domain protein, WbuC family n=1 Tax=Leptospira noguchii serovar Panama str. CZ214 TaxID=1001595 RepID=T0F9C4_9LEPT|nr:WbuC family cupin fold metalloprotein [Leptospira noguchii]EQA69793.1 cupin domain protein, WbuC family [Leptospira noguchii serovar Panama str. CZ214]
MKISIHKENDEVLYPKEDIVVIDKEDLEDLKKLALLNPRQRVRLCAHKTSNDRLHEMFIIHTKECYVRPHKHLEKAESMAIIEGEVDVVLFNENGTILKVIRMGDMNSGKLFYYRMSTPIYHSLFIRSEFLVFHESTEGPFLREQTFFPDWAPKENDPEVEKFITEIESQIKEK